MEDIISPSFTLCEWSRKDHPSMVDELPTSIQISSSALASAAGNKATAVLTWEFLSAVTASTPEFLADKARGQPRLTEGEPLLGAQYEKASGRLCYLEPKSISLNPWVKSY